jgi:putative endonuclease
VRYRRSPSHGSPLESVDGRKQRKLYQAAGHYLRQRQGSEPPCRFDVIGITGEQGEQIEWIENAFGQA